MHDSHEPESNLASTHCLTNVTCLKGNAMKLMRSKNPLSVEETQN